VPPTDEQELWPLDAVIGTHLTCVGCGYDLQSIRVSNACPECGRPVEWTLLVLPRPAVTAGYMKLAALAWIALAFGFTVIAGSLLLVAVGGLMLGCSLDHLRGVPNLLKWLSACAFIWVASQLAVQAPELANPTTNTTVGTRLLLEALGFVAILASMVLFPFFGRTLALRARDTRLARSFSYVPVFLVGGFAAVMLDVATGFKVLERAGIGAIAIGSLWQIGVTFHSARHIRAAPQRSLESGLVVASASHASTAADMRHGVDVATTSPLVQGRPS
jgi:hypothetical protein